ncbi:MAG: SpoVA/SpoVAEb family sporulation membrane protein [Clostridia bacterium]|nr:SpoVA/SpoVAEb family sporulation membrane protein [Clostridia bacterium]
MDIYTNEGKKKLIKENTPRSTLGKNLVKSFLIGGAISGGGEALRILLLKIGVAEKQAPVYVSLTIVSIAAVLTLLGVFDSIARHAGAGTLVPISGFSNAVTSQAIDAKSEGLVLGVGAKIFSICGPVILFGLAAGVIYGAIYYIAISFGW